MYRANVLLDHQFNAKLVDFDLARDMPRVVKGFSMITTPHAFKSLGYSAPELDSYHHLPKTDVYSYGIVRIIMLR